VLLVEDDPATCVALKMLLGRRGYEVAVATSAAAGCVALDAKPSCVILDLMLPDGSGTKVLRQIRNANLPIRVLVTTGLNDPEELAAVTSLGPDAILRKPIDLAELLAKLTLQH
jgi:two-component system response regulator QseB